MKKILCLMMMTWMAMPSPIVAADNFHPYHPAFHSAAHSSLAPGAPQWFRPGYGYHYPARNGFRLPQNPYLSVIADSPGPYSHVWLLENRRAARTNQWRPNSSMAGTPWYLPGEVFPAFGPRQEFGQLK